MSNQIKTRLLENGAIEWTADMRSLLGLGLTDDVVAAKILIDGKPISREAVARERERLGIPAARVKRAWTTSQVEYLATEPDNAKAAAHLDRTINQVKIARSRLKTQ